MVAVVKPPVVKKARVYKKPRETANPFTFRPTPWALEEMQERGPVSTVARQATQRYYDLLAWARQGLNFTPHEALVLVIALRAKPFDTGIIDSTIFWAVVQNEISRQSLDNLYKIDTGAMLRRLRTLHALHAVAILDAVDRFWLRVPPGKQPDINLVYTVGLARRSTS